MSRKIKFTIMIISLTPTILSGVNYTNNKDLFTILLFASSALVTLCFGYFVFFYSLDKSRSKISLIREKVGVLSGVTDQISNTSNNLSQGAIDQAQALEQTAAAAQEIYQTAGRNKSLTNESKELIENCLSGVQSGERSMNELNKAFQTISDSNIEFEEFIKESNKRFSEIKEVISLISDKTSVINDIVFQTKLLSFNASVEAARAGEHGKGFAVVAEEIGALASMSGKASNEISHILEEGLNKVENIITDTSSAVENILSLSSRNITNGESKVSKSIENYSDIKKQVEGIHQKMNEITLASNEQALGIEEVDKAIHLLEQNNHRTTLVAKQSLEISKSLNEEFSELEEVFRGLRDTHTHQDNVAEFIWDDKFEIGVDQMDEEHKVLIKKINIFVQALRNNDNVIEKFNDLKSYTLRHFSDEEEYMRSIGYHSLAAHQKIHKTMIEKILEYEKELHAGTLDKKRLVAFLKNWLVSHILGVDMQYAQVSRQQSHSKAS